MNTGQNLMSNELNEDFELDQDEAEETENDTIVELHEEDEEKEEDTSALKEKVKTLTHQKEYWRKKASEPEKKEVKETKPTKKSDDSLSQKDLFALVKANVHEDDVDEIIKASKLLGISITDALKDTTVKVILADRDEKRRTAEATSTRNTRAGAKKISDAELLSKANAGEVPDKGTDEAERLFWMRRGGKPE